MGGGQSAGRLRRLVAGDGQRHDSWRRRLLALGSERVGHVPRVLSGVESTAGITRLSRYVALHPIAGSRVALTQLFSVQPQLRSSVCCLADFALLQSHLAPVQSDVAWRWRWCRRRRIQPHVALIFSYLSELQPNISELQSNLAFLQPDIAKL